MDTASAWNMIPGIEFGTELRRQRVAAGLSLTDLGQLVHYSRSHLSKVETGAKTPSTDLARRCDAALECGGALGALATSIPAAAHSGAAVSGGGDADEVWVLSLESGGASGFGAVSRRTLLAGGVAGVAGLDAVSAFPARARRPAGGADPEVIASFRVMFDELRGLGQRLGPALLIPAVVSQAHALRSMAESAGSGPRGAAQRNAALVLAARYAEYAGWMEQEAGDEARVAWWTDRAVDLAARGGDGEMAAYALVRRGLITLYRDDAAATVALARQAGERARDPRVRGLAAQREAQGHAVAGDYDACFRALDRAAGLLSGGGAGGAASSGPVIGSTNVADPVAATVGWCLFDLGHPDRAAQVLRRELDRIPAGAVRARARYGARLALALAGGGEPDEACRVAQPVLDACEQIDSATIRSDLRSLSRALNRWHTRADVRDTRLRLTAALHTSGA